MPCTPDGYVIGDVILFYLAENRFNLVGRAPALNWVEFHARDRRLRRERRPRRAHRAARRRSPQELSLPAPGPERDEGAREGARPRAAGPQVLQHAHRDIAGKDVIALRHGMAGQPGYELFGPWEDYDAVHDALVEAGKEYGLTLVGGRAYFVEHAGIGLDPVAAAGGLHRRSDEGLPRVAARCGLRGQGLDRRQLRLDDIEDYYLTPWDLGYGHIVKFDHDFVGREALESDGRRPAPHEGHARARQRGRDAGHRLDAQPGRRPRQVHRVPQRGLLDAPVRRGQGRRQERSASRPGSATAPTRARC